MGNARNASRNEFRCFFARPDSHLRSVLTRRSSELAVHESRNIEVDNPGNGRIRRKRQQTEERTKRTTNGATSGFDLPGLHGPLVVWIHESPDAVHESRNIEV